MNSPGPSNPVYQNKWAGNVVVTPARYAQMEWHVPGGYPVGSTCGSMVSFWPGLGNGSSDQLVQAGSEDHYDCAAYGGGNFHYMWYESYPNETPLFVDPYGFGIGGDIFVSVSYDETTSTATYFMECVTTGQFHSYPEHIYGDTGSQADFVIEKGGNGLTAWNGGASISSAWFHDWDGNAYGAGQLAHDSYHLVWNGSDVAHGGAWTETSYYSAFPMYSSGTG